VKCNRGVAGFPATAITKGILSSPSVTFGATSPLRGRIVDVDALPLRSPRDLILPCQGEVARKA